MKLYLNFAILVFAAVLLSGCLYPQEKRVENQIPYEDQIKSVQTAIDQYRELNDGLLPIKTRESDTPIYIKYPIEFSKLAPRFLAAPPGNAYESGGVFQYVLIDVETNPTVKVLDLRIAEKIREVKLRIKTQGYPPFKEAISNNIYSLDYQKIGYKSEPYIISPFTHNNLPLVINLEGEVFVDYISDLYLAVKESGQNYKQGEDITSILTKNSLFVPAYSPSYTVDENNEPIYMEK
ncbi:hypothetical protein ACFFF5_01810 [Lederbergia wuyishanensis]|uniref:Uncharacterized protein n=1 Tax=Lederbergia wuyishanensis TaxID=1347903 RepID=A0ABU0D0Y4_9BACI|nr:hypothetical protein [Lederbergia wuyishanensis]MCJ8006683.1 hypothetical protein [Lederbergia wuyishanensis]MDQ0342065.1 hypothetical protein [Lederbergia wuyishanensis]